MSKKLIICLSIIFVFMISVMLIKPNKKDVTTKQSSLSATVLDISDGYVTVYDKNNVIYTFMNFPDDYVSIGDSLKINYEGKLNKKNVKQTASVISYSENEDEELLNLNDKGIFSKFYEMAYTKMKTLSLDEKIGQILLVRVPEEGALSDLEKYKFGGFVFYERDFKNKTKEQIINNIDALEEKSNIPLLIATDEEGGKVTRLSSNKNIVTEPFKSPSELYNLGGMSKIKEDTIYKSKVLKNLGINVNLAPVVDVATNPDSYMYDRTIKQDTKITSEYAKTVISSSIGTDVSYVLKHFPGYGNNVDTHETSSTDDRTTSQILEDDIPPFRAGIKAGAEAVLVSHNIVSALDTENEASLSYSVHNLLRDDLSFTGVIITDDLDMGGVKNTDKIVRAIKAGNDILIVTDYKTAINDIKSAINNEELSEKTLDKMVFRILAWKYYKGLMYDNQK